MSGSGQRWKSRMERPKRILTSGLATNVRPPGRRSRLLQNTVRKSGLCARMQFACREAAGFGETAKGRVAALGAFNNPAGDVAAVSVLLGSDRQRLACPLEGNLHVRDHSGIEVFCDHGLAPVCVRCKLRFSKAFPVWRKAISSGPLHCAECRLASSLRSAPARAASHGPVRGLPALRLPDRAWAA